VESGWVKSKTVASLFSVHHQRPRAGLIGPVSVKGDMVGIVFIYGMVLRCDRTFKIRLDSEPVTAHLTTTV